MLILLSGVVLFVLPAVVVVEVRYVVVWKVKVPARKQAGKRY
jgi:hypothetical protein